MTRLLEPIEVLGPERPCLRHRGSDLVETVPIERAHVLSPLAPLFHQARALEISEVLRHGLLRHRERRGQLVNARLSQREPLEDCAARGIGERGERRF